MKQQEILDHLRMVNDELNRLNCKGEICLYGGAVMCLVYNSRPSTKDVDAIFEPVRVIKEIVRKIAAEKGLSEDWLNDGVKGFVVEHPRQVFLELSNLTVYTADPEYLLAMKCLAARIDTIDNSDIRFLIKKLQLTSPDRVFTIIQKYYPKNQVRPVTQFFIEELFESI
ncbi:MAG: hypothetical protein JW913_09480 [Chitinispirillaceae bacterium]|nr:hypothetical protein [Chitinispirillaceae bacterium]